MQPLTQVRREQRDTEIGTGRGLGGFAARSQRRKWDGRAHRWDHEGALGLAQVIVAVLGAAEAQAGTVAVDLGCGTGQLSLPMARSGAHVTGVDISPAMVDRLLEKARSSGLDRVDGVVSPIERFDLSSDSVDLVVSNYALHHLRDRDKRVLLNAVARWLRPGGRLVLGDMMFGRGSSARDRAIIISKIWVLARRGPGGWWRLIKNVGRFSLRLQERPITIQAWRHYFEEAGFTELSVVPVVSEAAVITGVKP